MSEHDPLDDSNDPDEILKELDSLKGLLGEGEAAEGPAPAAAEGGDPGVAEWDLDAFIDEDEAPAPEASQETEASLDAGSDTFPEPGEEAEPAGPDMEDAGEVPVLEDVVFRGNDVPGEAVGLMSALAALPDEAQAETPTGTGADALDTMEATAPPTGTETAEAEWDAVAAAEPAEAEAVPPPEPATADPATLQALAEEIVDRRLAGLREQLKAEVIEEFRQRLGNDRSQDGGEGMDAESDYVQDGRYVAKGMDAESGYVQDGRYVAKGMDAESD